jgi:hypothetical protein
MATITTQAPKSGSCSNSALTNTRTSKQRQESAQQRLLSGCSAAERRLAHRVACRVKDDGELHQLRRLQVDDVERQPALAAVDALADAGDQHRDQQRRAGDEQVRC